MKMWQGRFKKEEDERVNDFNSSISFDSRMYKQDITGSIAHARMLGKTGIIEESESEKIVEGLKGILHDIESGNLDVIEPGGLNATGAVLAFIFGVVVVLVLLIGYNVSKKKNIKA